MMDLPIVIDRWAGQEDITFNAGADESEAVLFWTAAAVRQRPRIAFGETIVRRLKIDVENFSRVFPAHLARATTGTDDRGRSTQRPHREDALARTSLAKKGRIAEPELSRWKDMYPTMRPQAERAARLWRSIPRRASFAPCRAASGRFHLMPNPLPICIFSVNPPYVQ